MGILTTFDGVADCTSLSSKGDTGITKHTLHSMEDFKQDIKYPLCLLQGFTISFADGDSENSTCKFTSHGLSIFLFATTQSLETFAKTFANSSLYLLDLFITNKCLTTANGTGPCLQEGTVRLHLNDNNGVKHIFILDNCLHHPDSPVNLLSTRLLMEKFINSQGNPDKQTRIESRYSTHVLTRSFGSFKKTFPTPPSGLPELLFDKGFQAYKSFCMQVSSYATIDEATHSANIISFNDNEVQGLTVDNKEDINMLFMVNETIVFKDGKGINQEVTYLGPIFSCGI
jgi:hypothetical protein